MVPDMPCDGALEPGPTGSAELRNPFDICPILLTLADEGDRDLADGSLELFRTLGIGR